MTILQIDPPLPVLIINKGKGYAHFLIDYGIEDHIYWVIFMDDTGECWTVENPKVRMQNNPTLNRIVKSDSKTFKVYDGLMENPPYTL